MALKANYTTSWNGTIQDVFIKLRPVIDRVSERAEIHALIWYSESMFDEKKTPMERKVAMTVDANSRQTEPIWKEREVTDPVTGEATLETYQDGEKTTYPSFSDVFGYDKFVEGKNDNVLAYDAVKAFKVFGDTVDVIR